MLNRPLGLNRESCKDNEDIEDNWDSKQKFVAWLLVESSKLKDLAVLWLSTPAETRRVPDGLAVLRGKVADGDQCGGLSQQWTKEISSDSTKNHWFTTRGSKQTVHEPDQS